MKGSIEMQDAAGKTILSLQNQQLYNGMPVNIDNL